MINRRRFLSITAGTGFTALAGPKAFAATASHQWRGVALGASASISIAHEDARQLVSLARAEIARLEGMFSLYDTDSALFRLNATGHLDEPPFELIELLSLCGSINRLTDGAFDPTIQPLWALYAERYSAGAKPRNAEIARALSQTGWHRLNYSPRKVSFSGKGMALTLNGIAQGFIADKVAALLRQNGVTDTLVNMGEIVALGRRPSGNPWQVGIADPTDPGKARKYKYLENSAIATSAPLGTVFDQNGSSGHILDPRSGHPGGKWRQVSVMATHAALADGLSTAFCLMSKDQIDQASQNVQVDLLPLI